MKLFKKKQKTSNTKTTEQKIYIIFIIVFVFLAVLYFCISAFKIVGDIENTINSLKTNVPDVFKQEINENEIITNPIMENDKNSFLQKVGTSGANANFITNEQFDYNVYNTNEKFTMDSDITLTAKELGAFVNLTIIDNSYLISEFKEISIENHFNKQYKIISIAKMYIKDILKDYYEKDIQDYIYLTTQSIICVNGNTFEIVENQSTVVLNDGEKNNSDAKKLINKMFKENSNVTIENYATMFIVEFIRDFVNKLEIESINDWQIEIKVDEISVFF